MASLTTPYGTDITSLRKEVYDALLPSFRKKPDQLYGQDALEALPCIAEIKPLDNLALAYVINELIRLRFFKPMKFSDGTPGWKLRSEGDAEKYFVLSNEQAMVYEQIEESGGDGIWLKTIRQRLNMHESTVNNAVKHLQSKSYVRDLQNVANSNRRMYIKVGVAQSDRSTGGPWYTDGELDEVFVEIIMKLLYDKILASSVQPSKAGRHAVDRIERKMEAIRKTALAKAEKEKLRAKNPKKGTKAVSADEATAIRDKALGGGRVVDPKEVEEDYNMRKTIYEEFFPFPAGYLNYPKLDPLTEYVLDTKVCEDVVLTAHDIGLCLDIMVLDKKIEEVDCGDALGYKVTRQSLRPVENSYNVYTEAPCGRCPVFDLCEEGGPVGPSNCEYFTEWLAS